VGGALQVGMYDALMHPRPNVPWRECCVMRCLLDPHGKSVGGAPRAGMYDALMQLQPYAARALQIGVQPPPGHAAASRLGQARF